MVLRKTKHTHTHIYLEPLNMACHTEWFDVPVLQTTWVMCFVCSLQFWSCFGLGQVIWPCFLSVAGSAANAEPESHAHGKNWDPGTAIGPIGSTFFNRGWTPSLGIVLHDLFFDGHRVPMSREFSGAYPPFSWFWSLPMARNDQVNTVPPRKKWIKMASRNPNEVRAQTGQQDS